ncbi:hypothetical protein OG783_33645 (plasmid) [Streptomyces jietaisiensis]|uniref:hypothetical protein n=1 Tax=Streptomyces griseoaurantiacus TaxID=68213 RepID=UPI003243F431
MYALPSLGLTWVDSLRGWWRGRSRLRVVHASQRAAGSDDDHDGGLTPGHQVPPVYRALDQTGGVGEARAGFGYTLQ